MNRERRGEMMPRHNHHRESRRQFNYLAYTEKDCPVESASALIDAKIKELGDWRGKTLVIVALNLKSKSKPKPRRASSKRPD